MKKQSDKNKFVVIVAPIIIILSIVLGLKYFSAKNNQETITPVNTNGQKDEEEIVSVDLEGELPADFPNNFPVFKGAEIEESWETRNKDAYAMSILWRVESTPEDVFDYYEQEFTLAGYVINVLSSESDSYTISFDDSNEKGFVGIVKDGKDTIISATIGNIGI